jgi:hypothetical protein
VLNEAQKLIQNQHSDVSLISVSVPWFPQLLFRSVTDLEQVPEMQSRCAALNAEIKSGAQNTSANTTPHKPRARAVPKQRGSLSQIDFGTAPPAPQAQQQQVAQTLVDHQDTVRSSVAPSDPAKESVTTIAPASPQTTLTPPAQFSAPSEEFGRFIRSFSDHLKASGQPSLAEQLAASASPGHGYHRSPTAPTDPSLGQVFPVPGSQFDSPDRRVSVQKVRDSLDPTSAILAGMEERANDDQFVLPSQGQQGQQDHGSPVPKPSAPVRSIGEARARRDARQKSDRADRASAPGTPVQKSGWSGLSAPGGQVPHPTPQPSMPRETPGPVTHSVEKVDQEEDFNDFNDPADDQASPVDAVALVDAHFDAKVERQIARLHADGLSQDDLQVWEDVRVDYNSLSVDDRFRRRDHAQNMSRTIGVILNEFIDLFD